MFSVGFTQNRIEQKNMLILKILGRALPTRAGKGAAAGRNGGQSLLFYF
jgi:hypothetical protein